MPGKRAWITGASAGIGKAFAERLARDGYDLVLVARGRERLEALAHALHLQYGRNVETIVADLADSTDLALVERKIASDAEATMLVNNAGRLNVGSFVSLELDGEEALIRLNVVGTVRLTRAVLPRMIERRAGTIINVSSISGFLPGPFTASYNASKAYINSFTDALDRELDGTGITLQLLCPGFTRTEIIKRAGADASKIPAWAWMTTDEVVNASLARLGRGLICIPGTGYRIFAALLRLLPRRLRRNLPPWPQIQ
jgi:short-subunit dehydrogenase